MWSINNPEAVRAAIRDRLRREFDLAWISQLVMHEVNEFWGRVKEIQAAHHSKELGEESKQEEGVGRDKS